MTPPFPPTPAAAQPPRTALLIDRQPERLTAAQRELARVPGLRIAGAIANVGLGIVSAVRHAPDCILLGWDGTAGATADIVFMLKRVRASQKVVVVTATTEEQALAQGRVAQASAVWPVRELALLLPGLLAGGRSPA